VGEPHPGADLEQPSGFRGRGCLAHDAEVVGGSPQQRRVPGRLGGGDQQEQLRLGRQGGRTAAEAVLDAVRDAERVRQLVPAGQLRATRQLQQRQRVAARLGDDPVAHVLSQRCADRRGQQRPRVGLAEPLQAQLGQPRERVDVAAAVVPHGEHERQLLRRYSPRHEGEDLRGRLVQPLRVVDQAQQRRVLGDLGQQVQGGQPHQEPVGCGALALSERHVQCVSLRLRKRSRAVQQRRAQLVQAGERELRLDSAPAAACT
jgi:hypothetical protein